ncbi:MAG: sulfide/dihydroorotate dehydrogenase-like FAD/NAD-binding protein [Acidimicrobiia bacterium]|jgi:ferredoxin/flavodoxin---NADP+ reductase
MRHDSIVGYAILATETLAPSVRRLRIEAPRVARHQRPGQFVIVRPLPDSERIPITISAADPVEGWIELIVQGVGKTTMLLDDLPEGAEVSDVVGPLGRPSDVHRYGTVAVIGGGVGTAIALPTAAALHRAGNRVIGIVGGRTRELVILEDELAEVCDEVIACTDDGSYGRPGLVTDALEDLIESGTTIDHVLAIGPIPMMAAVERLTAGHGIPTSVSLNPLMVDGTGMCGGCRVSVGGETKFACVDGPEFDAHAVDFELLARRNQAYREFEVEHRRDYEEECRLEQAR